MAKIAFHSNQIGLRGTEVALYDYAYYNREILKNESIIVSNKNSNLDALKKFESQFEVFLYDSPEEIDKIVTDNNVDIFYAQKAGEKDNIFSTKCKNVVHAVFPNHQPHGDAYAHISKWLAGALNWPHYVPYIVKKLDYHGDLREKLGIPENAIVFGRHGGLDTFDIPFVKEIVVRIAEIRPDIYFLFLNTDVFTRGLKNIIHLQGTSSEVVKSKFIHTCDAMLHARGRGETFGLAVAEFSIANKPVITWSGSPEKCHTDILGDKGLYYYNPQDLVNILLNFSPDNTKDWDAYSKDFNPEAIMAKFKQVFID